ncbi:DNA-binding response regulator, OmpR family, contains REC and winged-helix (wHTH) domain [Paenibacillus sp. UNCCL117]|uniref:response regulator transcription factor n=1 Tax=unclassified Paenibacillus TaxID=185978 RepID=UPI00088014CF|nr:MULTISPECIES: response regulator transcription factor [unclassified Paenibacillus]SDE14438.1 DNA-binding response regulator, OmpR family, contains REC and winged-helix (wHTH) domain [Paenibacillus sp. cl123]SFW60599.1 DNA-binding response regulator, OmpR family, contains REC and winged-helix (wHTH) domain [Paenibacillus sp. UNCCL117]
MNQVLVVDDDPFIRRLVKATLQAEGFTVLEAENGKEALALLESESVALVVLDIMMPHMDGWELCREIRRYYADLPLLMVTARSQSSDKVKGFQLGTDDYLVKPFDPMELVMRVRALLKRYRISLSQTVRFGGLEMNREQYEAVCGGIRLELPLKEFELLFKLASYPNQIFTRNQLIEQIWGLDYDGDERTVDVHIKRLRERLPEQGAGLAIKTIRGLGYKLEAAP